MDCKTADEYINLYIDDILGKEETEELFSHIASCRKCSRELQYAFELKNGMSGMGELEPPLGLAQSAIKKARKGAGYRFTLIFRQVLPQSSSRQYCFLQAFQGYKIIQPQVSLKTTFQLIKK